MTEQDLKYQDLKREYEALKKENERLRFSNSLLEKELKEQKDHIADSNKKVVTNADRIRSMSDEELAEILFESCMYVTGIECEKIACAGGVTCNKCILGWLKEKVGQ